MQWLALKDGHLLCETGLLALENGGKPPNCPQTGWLNEVSFSERSWNLKYACQVVKVKKMTDIIWYEGESGETGIVSKKRFKRH